MKMHNSLVSRYCEWSWMWSVAVYCNSIHLQPWQDLKEVVEDILCTEYIILILQLSIMITQKLHGF